MALANSILLYGLRSAQPAAAAQYNGVYYRVTNEGNVIEQCNGSSWIPIGATAGGAPGAHASSHQNGGTDEISVAGLSGLLADPQTPAAHASAHATGGSDPVSPASIGAVAKAASSTDNAIARYDGSSGGSVQDSLVKVEDDGRVSNVTNPSGAQDAATKNYVDAAILSAATNLGKRGTVRAATTANITIATALNAGDSIDGVTLANGDAVLVKDQSAPAENGVYIAGVSPARASEFDTYDEVPGSLLTVQEGTSQADTLWLCTSNIGGTLGTTAIAFAQASITAGMNQLTADVTAGPGAGSQAATIAANAVTNAKLADMAQATVKMRAAGAGTGDPIDGTPNQLSTVLDSATDPFLRTSAAPTGGSGGIGDVTGAASSTDNAIARFNGTTGKSIQNSTPTLEDDGRIATLTDPTGAQDAATKAYVDALAVNVGKRARVRAATTANITISTALNNADALDGVTLATGDLVLVKNQSAPAENGVYVVGVSPARFSEFDAFDEHPGSLVAVEEGTTNADTLWLCTTNVGGTLNTTAIAFSMLNVAGTVTTTGSPVSGNLAKFSASSSITAATQSDVRSVAALEACAGAMLYVVGDLAFVQLMSAMVIAKWEITGFDTTGASVSGSAVVDVWNDSDANYPPTVADSVAAGHKPTLSAAVKAIDTGISWSVAQYSWLVFKLESMSTCDHVLVQLFGTRS